MEYLIFDKAFYTFKNLPEFMFIQSGVGSSHKADSADKRLANSRRSPIYSSNKSNRHLLNVSGTKNSKTTFDHIDRIGETRVESRGGSPSKFLEESPSKAKGDKY